jgi:hypothetical protein
MTLLSTISTPVAELVQAHQIQNFVETGCWIGTGLIEARKSGIKNLYSCDIDRRAARISKAKAPDATIWHSTSIDFLNGILPEVKGVTMFWLDAHFPEDFWCKHHIDEEAKFLDPANDWRLEVSEADRFPLFHEIMLIKKLKEDYEKDVILCDDIHVFQDEENEYRNPDVPEGYKQHGGWRTFKWLLSDTHDMSVLEYGEKVAVWTPKIAVDFP